MENWKKLEWKNWNGKTGMVMVMEKTLIGTLKLSLLNRKNGLDNGVHFSSQSIAIKLKHKLGVCKNIFRTKIASPIVTIAEKKNGTKPNKTCHQK
jgi:hypothetical protein